MASGALQRLSLSSGEAGEDSRGPGIDCAHIRRGDFKSFAPQFSLDDAEMSAKLKSMFSCQRPVLIVSDEQVALDICDDVANVQSSGAYVGDVSEQTRVAVDMIMCSRAVEFIGSPESTFTNGILELRRRHALLTGGPAVATKLYAGEADFSVRKGQKCWKKQTTFNSSLLCDGGATA